MGRNIISRSYFYASRLSFTQVERRVAMHILFDRNTLEVIATIGAKEDIVKEPYELIDLGDKEPTFENKDGKLIFNGLKIIGE